MQNYNGNENQEIDPYQQIDNFIPTAKPEPSLWSKDRVLSLLTDKRIQAAAIGFPYGAAMMFWWVNYGAISTIGLISATAFGMLAYRFLFGDSDDA
jgi:hypothetical protein